MPNAGHACARTRHAHPPHEGPREPRGRASPRGSSSLRGPAGSVASGDGLALGAPRDHATPSTGWVILKKKERKTPRPPGLADA